MLGGGAVQPDDVAVADVDLAVNDSTFVVSIDPAGPQAERADQEVVGSLNVLADKQWGDPL